VRRFAASFLRPENYEKLAQVLELRSVGAVRHSSVFFLALATGLASPPCLASEISSPSRAVRLSLEKPSEGQAEIKLDKLVFPKDVQDGKAFEKHLKRTLRREAYRADWGAGRANKIEYRFEVTQLAFTLEEGALRIKCAAIGRLPGGQTAKSQLSFGGDPGQRMKLTKRVLEIVARGVVTRLAELERRRRGLR